MPSERHRRPEIQRGMPDTGHNLPSETGRIWHSEHHAVCRWTMALCTKELIHMKRWTNHHIQSKLDSEGDQTAQLLLKIKCALLL